MTRSGSGSRRRATLVAVGVAMTAALAVWLRSARSTQEQAPLQLAPGGASAVGSVRSVDGKPVAGALVQARRAGPAFSLSAPLSAAFSDRSGRYALALAPGDNLLEISHPNHVTEFRTLAGATTGRWLADVELLPPAILRGRVLRRLDGSAIPNASVRVRADAERAPLGVGWRSTRTDPSGAFELGGLRPGPLWLEAWSVDSSTSAPVSLAVRAGEPGDPVDVQLEPAHRLAGKVVGGESPPTPPEGLRVIAIDAVTGESRASELTDAQGSFEIFGLRPGAYALEVRGDRALEVASGASAVLDGADEIEHVVALRPCFHVSGNVEPPAPAEVTLTREASDGTTVNAATDPAGAFRVSCLPVGSYALSARTSEGRVGTANVRLLDRHAEAVRVPVALGSSLSGQVTDEEGRPLVDVSVEVNAADGWRAARTDERGQFALTGLGAGSYRLELRDDLGRRRWAESTKGDARDEAVTVVADPPGSATKRVLVAEACNDVLRGRVIENGAPHAHAWLALSRDEPENQYTEQARLAEARWLRASSDGRFEIREVCKGKYRIRAFSPSGNLSDSQDVTHDANVTLTLRQGSPLSGLVRFRDAPVTSFELALAGPTPLRRRIRSPEGSFELPALHAGTYEMMVSADQGYALELLSIEAGSPPHEVALTEWATLRGRLVTAQGAPAAGARVDAVLHPSDGPALDLFGPALRIRSVQSDGRGDFVVPRVLAAKGHLAVIRAERRLLIERASYEGDSGPLVGARTWLSFDLRVAKDLDLGELVVRE